MNLVNRISCFLVIGALLWSFYQYRRNRAANDSSLPVLEAGKRRWELAAVLIIVLAGFFRLFLLGSVPGAVNQDSAMSAIDAKSLMTLGTDHWGIEWPVHMKGWAYAQQSPLLTYMLIPFFSLFGISDFTLHLPMVLVSMAGMIFLYLTVRDIWGRELAIISLAVVSFNPWHFAQSRWALDANLFPHVFMIGFYFLQKGLTKSKCLYLSMVFFALCHYCYGISIYTVPFFLLLVLIWLLRSRQIHKSGQVRSDRPGWRQIIWSMIIYVGISLPFFITMFLNAFRLPTINTPIFTLPFFEESTRSGDILFFSEHPWEQFIINTKAVFELIVLQKLDILWDGIPEYGTVYLAMIPVFL